MATKVTTDSDNAGRRAPVSRPTPSRWPAFHGDASNLCDEEAIGGAVPRAPPSGAKVDHNTTALE
jgi:hypothetical protein